MDPITFHSNCRTSADLGFRMAFKTDLTSLLLHLVVSLPVRHSAVISLSRSSDFLEAVSSHLSLVAPLTRLLGMLVA